MKFYIYFKLKIELILINNTKKKIWKKFIKNKKLLFSKIKILISSK